MKKPSLFFILWCLAIIWIDFGEAQTTQRPNIIFVMADDYGYNDVGYHGSEIKTPNIDEISAAGIRLENYYVQPMCTPSRSQLMSGRYQIHTGLQHGVITATQANALPRDSPTLADKMREAGYVTHCVGKWHLGFYKTEFIPINRGFDTFYGFYTGGGDYFTHKRTWLDGKDYLDLRDQDKPVTTETGVYSTNLFSDKAIERIRNHDNSKPMFMYLAYQAVHAPVEAPESYQKPYAFIQNKQRRTYAGMVAAMDEGFGNVTKALQETGMWNNTVLIFSTDNGGQSHKGGNNYPLRGGKLTLWEGGMRAVGFVHAPNMKMAGKVNKALIHVSDWYPTILGLAGGSLNGTMPLDGYDQWQTISDGQSSPRKVILHNIDPLRYPRGAVLHNDTFDNRVRAAIRSGDWKLITGDPGVGTWVAPPTKHANVKRLTEPHSKNLWLFNVKDDPLEKSDKSADYPERVKELLDLLSHYQSTAVKARYPPKYDKKSNPAKIGGVWGPWED